MSKVLGFGGAYQKIIGLGVRCVVKKNWSAEEKFLRIQKGPNTAAEKLRINARAPLYPTGARYD